MPESEPKPKLIELVAPGAGQGWKAVLKSGKQVVVHEIPAPAAEAGAAVPRLQRLAEHRHPSLAPVLAWGTDPNGIWVAVEPNEGTSLGTILSRGPLTPPAAAALGAAILSGVAALHEEGIAMGGFGATAIRVTGNGEVRLSGHPAAAVRGAPSQSDLRADVRSCGMAICAAFGVDPAGAPAPPTIPPGLVVTMRSMASGAMGPAADRAQGALREMASALLAPDRMTAAQSELALRAGGRELPSITPYLPKDTFPPAPAPPQPPPAAPAPYVPRPIPDETPVRAPASYEPPPRSVETYPAIPVPPAPPPYVPPPREEPPPPPPASYEPPPRAPETFPTVTPPAAAPDVPTWDAKPAAPAPTPVVPAWDAKPEAPAAKPGEETWDTALSAAAPTPAPTAAPPPTSASPPSSTSTWDTFPPAPAKEEAAPASAASTPPAAPAEPKPTWTAIPTPTWTAASDVAAKEEPAAATPTPPTPPTPPSPSFTPQAPAYVAPAPAAAPAPPTLPRAPISAPAPTPARKPPAPRRPAHDQPSERPAWLVPAAAVIVVLLLLGVGGGIFLAGRGGSPNNHVATTSPKASPKASPRTSPSPPAITGPLPVPTNYAPAAAAPITGVVFCSSGQCADPSSNTSCTLGGSCKVTVEIKFSSVQRGDIAYILKFFDRCTGTTTDLPGNHFTPPGYITVDITAVVSLPTGVKSAGLVAVTTSPTSAASAPLLLGGSSCA